MSLQSVRKSEREREKTTKACKKASQESKAATARQALTALNSQILQYVIKSKNHSFSNFVLFFQQSGGGYVTDEELELCQTIEDRNQSEERERRATSGSRAVAVAGDDCDSPGGGGAAVVQSEDIQSPSKEVLIADNESRR